MAKKTEGTVVDAEFTSDVKLPVIELALEKIRVDETKNLRRFNPDAKTVEELALDIRKNKMLEPVLVKKINQSELDAAGPAEYELVAGYQRMKALTYLNDHGDSIDSVSASVVEIEDGDDRKAKILNIKENLRRSEISYIDIAHAAQELIATGMTAAEVATEFNKSRAWMSYVIAMLGLRPEIQKKIATGVIPFKVAKGLPALSEAEQDKGIAQLESGMSSTDVEKRSKIGKKRKSNRGRKEAGEAAEGKNISSKAAILALEELVAGLSAEPEEEAEGKKKVNKAEAAAVEYAVGLYKDVIKFLSGGIGAKALHNRVIKSV